MQTIVAFLIINLLATGSHDSQKHLRNFDNNTVIEVPSSEKESFTTTANGSRTPEIICRRATKIILENSPCSKVSLEAQDVFNELGCAARSSDMATFVKLQQKICDIQD